MVEQRTRQMPLHGLLTDLDAWRSEQSEESFEALGRAFSRVLEAYGIKGAYVEVKAAGWPNLHLGAGSLEGLTGQAAQSKGSLHALDFQASSGGAARLWVDGDGEAAQTFSSAVELALDAVASRHQARIQRQQLEALDAAVRGIAAVQAVDTVLQLIVDQVRELVEAEYAALGIVGPFGNIEQFITSGLTPQQRTKIGALPVGRGLLGLIIREDSSFLIDDIATDHRRYGFPPNHPAMHSFLGAPVRSKGRSIGNLYLTNKLTAPAFSEADLRLVEMFALHAGIAMENARLHDEIQRLAVVDERQRISQDLHDSIIQSLYGISLSLEDLPEIIAEDPAEGADRADRAIDSIHGTIRDIRNFIFGLQPELLGEADLASGIQSLAAEFRTNTLIDIDVLIAEGLPELPVGHAAHILAITREGLSNMARHSRATRASVALDVDDGVVRLTIGDNGAGFDPAQPRSSAQHGLTNLRSRAEAAGGMLTVSSGVGAGTRLLAEFPLRAQK
jgi:signal transduction histidine kinase